MSKSYKKIPYCGERRNKHMKNYANRRIRRNKKLKLNNKSYKKYTNSYDIRDYYFIEDFENLYKGMKNLYPEMPLGIVHTDKDSIMS